ncbi:MAG TPA: LytR family transcriptional regulator [Anaerolineales bacterium]|nr:LytR family transcriptional regulator [Anaerolineales bacterium]
MQKSQKTFLGILALIALALVSLIFYEGTKVYRYWSQKPLGAVLEYPTLASSMGARDNATVVSALQTIFPAGTLVPSATVDIESTKMPFSTEISRTETLMPSQTLSASICGNLPPMMLLGIGSDARSDAYLYGRADVIRAIRIDFQAETVTILAFPRDLWVDIPEISDNLGSSYQKLNTAYIYGNPGLGYWDHPSEGPGLLARTLERNFGLRADHYLAISMDVFVDAIDALGGLDFYFPNGVDGRSSYDQSERLVFPAGENHLNGEQVLTFARMRNISTFTRSNHQNVVMCTLEEKIKSPAIIPKIPALISAFTDNIQTDLTPEQITQLACLGTQMPRSNIIFASFPKGTFGDSYVYDPILGANTFTYSSDYDVLRSYVAQFEAGTWPSVDSEISSSNVNGEGRGMGSRCE